MNKNSALRRFLRNVYGYSFFNKLILLTPVYAVFMQKHGLICAGGAAFVMFSLFYSVSGLWALGLAFATNVRWPIRRVHTR